VHAAGGYERRLVHYVKSSRCVEDTESIDPLCSSTPKPKRPRLTAHGVACPMWFWPSVTICVRSPQLIRTGPFHLGGHGSIKSLPM